MATVTSPARRRVPRLGSPAWVAFAAGLPPSLADDPALVAYARRTRRWRIVAVLTAYMVSSAITYFSVRMQRAGPSWNLAAALGVGWFLGGLLPELFVRHRDPSTVRVAGLDDRRAGRYVTSTSRRWLLASYVVAASQAAITPIAGLTFTREHLVGVSIVLVVSAIGTAAVRRIAARSQPAGDANDLAVDEAIRIVATTRAVAGWAALQFAAGIALIPRGLELTDRVPTGTTIYLVYASYIGIIACWAWVPTRALPQHSIAAVDVT